MPDHPTDGDLIAYLYRRLPESRNEEVQAHLIECEGCLELFKDVRDFFDLHREGEQMLTEDIAHEWKSVWRRVKNDERAQETLPEKSKTLRRLNAQAILAIAAMLLIMMGVGLWGLRQRQQARQLNQQLAVSEQRAGQLQTEQDDLAAKNNQLAQQILELQERVHSNEQAASEKSNEVRAKPEVNVPIYDVYAENFTRRSTDQGELNRIKVPRQANTIVLIMNGEGVASAASYDVQMLSGTNGQVVWRARGLKKDRSGNFTVTLQRSSLANGIYRLKLFGTTEDARSLAEYVIQVEL